MAAGEEVRLVIREGWMDYFGGRNETFHVSVNAPGSAGQRLGWALSAGGRVVARGETAVDETSVGAFAVTMPSVKEGVVVNGVRVPRTAQLEPLFVETDTVIVLLLETTPP